MSTRTHLGHTTQEASSNEVLRQPADADAVSEIASALAPAAIGEAVADRGRGISPRLREVFEERFGLALGDVRVHEGSAASSASMLSGARAIAIGPDIIVGHGEPDESTVDGERLLAHEVSHVAQWRRASATHAGWSRPGDQAERTADAAAEGDAGASVHAPTGSVAAASRQSKPDTKSAADEQAMRNTVLGQLGRLRQTDRSAFLEIVTKNDGPMYALLGKYGYHGCWEKPDDYVADFDQAHLKWFMKEVATVPLPLIRSVMPTIDPEEFKRWQASEDQLIMGQLADGTPFTGKRRDYRAAQRWVAFERWQRTGDNIRGGIFGAIGYGLGGDEGSDVGAVADGLAMAAGGVAQGRSQMRDVGRSLEPRRDTVAEVRPSRPASVGPSSTPSSGASAPTTPAEPPPTYSEYPPMKVAPAPVAPAPVAPAPVAPAPVAPAPVAPTPLGPSTGGASPAQKSTPTPKVNGPAEQTAPVSPTKSAAKPPPTVSSPPVAEEPAAPMGGN